MNNPKILRTLIVIFGLVTALIHFWLFYMGLMRPRGMSVIQYLFLLNGLGYLALLGAFFMALSRDRWRQLVHYLFIVFVALTIIAWVIVNHGRFLITLSTIDKVSEVFLIGALWLHLHVTQRLTEPAAS